MISEEIYIMSAAGDSDNRRNLSLHTFNQVFQSENRPSIGFAQFGDSTGIPVLYFHGLPGSRFEGLLWDKSAQSLRIRLIAIDRPGMGLSAYDSSRTLQDYPDDIAQIVEHLQLNEFTILAVSGGGPPALACAANKIKLPGLKGVAVVAGIGPRDLTKDGMSIMQKLSFHAMDWIPGGVVGWLWDAMLGKSARNPDPAVLEKSIKKGLSAIKGSDRELYKDDVVVQGFTESLRGAFIQGSQGYVHEATLVSKPWEVELESIDGVPICLWYGGNDDIAPMAVGKALASKIPTAALQELPGDSHTTTILRHQEDILRALCGLEKD